MDEASHEFKLQRYHDETFVWEYLDFFEDCFCEINSEEDNLQLSIGEQIIEDIIDAVGSSEKPILDILFEMKEVCLTNRDEQLYLNERLVSKNPYSMSTDVHKIISDLKLCILDDMIDLILGEHDGICYSDLEEEYLDFDKR